jgi:hypothetical protein
MTTEHKDIDDLKSRFEDGDRPTGDDFARLIDSCHNTRQLTDVTITQSLSVQGGLTVDGSINTRDVAADGAKLDSLDSFVRNNSDSWEETADIQSVTTQLQTASGTLSDSINNVNETLIERIDDDNATINTRVDGIQASLTTHIDTSIQTLTNTVDTNNTNINNLVASNHSDINARVDGVLTGLGDTQDAVDEVTSTVFTNSASWGVDENTNSLHNLLDVEIGTINHSDVLKFDANDGVWRPATDLHGEGQHVDTFLELHDTSVAYTGAGKFVKINETNDGLTFVDHDTASWIDTTSVVQSNSAQWATQTDITNLTNTVATNSASWNDHTDVTNLTNTVATNSASWASHTDVSDLTTGLTDVTNTVATNSASWASHTDVSDLTTGLTDVTNTVATNSASWNDHTDITNLTNTVATNSASWNDHTDITNLTNTVATNSASWNDHTDVSDITSGLTDVTNTVATNSASWNDHTDVTNLTNTVATNSGSWARLDMNGKLLEDQIPELSITQTYTVQNSEEVTSLNPAEGIQRGDIVIVTSTYDNLIAKQDNPTGVYNPTTKSYSGYSKLARPDAFVTSVNDMYGNVTIQSDNISDVDNVNKWTSQNDHDSWNAKLNSTGGTMTGNLDTTATYLSAGTPLHDIFSTSNTIVGDMSVDGNITATSIQAVHKSNDGQTGITKNVNVGGNILHIVDGIIVGITDEV